MPAAHGTTSGAVGWAFLYPSEYLSLKFSLGSCDCNFQKQGKHNKLLGLIWKKKTQTNIILTTQAYAMIKGAMEMVELELLGKHKSSELTNVFDNPAKKKKGERDRLMFFTKCQNVF